METKTTQFGLHLMLDAYNCDHTRLDDANFIYKFLNDLPGHIDMHLLTKPYMVHCEGNNKKDPGGWSGVVLIEESHISIHTFVKRRFFTADVYSCKEFDVQHALKHFKEAFKTEDVEYYVQKRGQKYPLENLV